MKRSFLARPRGRVTAESLEPRTLLATFTVTSAESFGPGTLHQAITDANATPDPDVIAFDIPGAAGAVRRITSSLPTVYWPLTIDGTTQPGYSPGRPVVQLSATGLIFSSEAAAPAPGNIDGSVIRGLIVFTNLGALTLHRGRNIVVEGNWFGLDADGNGGMNPGGGVSAFDVHDSHFGGTTPQQRNVFSAQIDGAGLTVRGSGNVVQGNYVGTDATGTRSVPNRIGVLVSGARNTVGGTAPGAGNVISGNADAGVMVQQYDVPPTGNVIAGNTIGLTADGRALLRNRNSGVHLSFGSLDNVVGGTEPGAGNVIGGSEVGVRIAERADADNGNGDRVEGNFIGVTPAGLRVPNGTGVFVENSGGNTIGGASEAARNVISGNDDVGVQVKAWRPQDNPDNRVVGNWIGVGPVPQPGGGTAAGAVGNFVGVVVEFSRGVVVGGTTPAERNVISGNGSDGVRIRSDSTGVRLSGNYIGLDPSGSAALGNGGDGISVDRPGAITIGGANAAEGNVISANGSNGIEVTNGGVVVRFNRIGTDAAGAAALGNRASGLHVAGPPTNPIAGNNSVRDNLISGNVADGVRFTGLASGHLTGNRIGTDAAGEAALPNGTGVRLEGPATADVRENLISGNSGFGVLLDGSDGNTITRNSIGIVAVAPAAVPLPNGSGGILLRGGADNNDVSTNAVAHNGGPGVHVSDGVRNWVGLNVIHSNAGLGIDLGALGVTPNDPLDADTGANRLQNFPVITGVVVTERETIVSGVLTGEPRTGGYRVDVYSNAEADASGHGEGRRPEGVAINLGTDAAGQASWTVWLPFRVAEGSYLTATASREVPAPVPGETSEFSPAVRVPPPDTQPPLVTAVHVRGSDWSEAYKRRLEADGIGSALYGYAVPAGAAQLDPLPWVFLNFVNVTFSEPVIVRREALRFSADGVGGSELVGTFHYEPATLTATWQFFSTERATRLRFLVDASDYSTITDEAGNALDGEWANGADDFPSGNGAAGGDFDFLVHRLAGDVDRNGRVNALDLAEVKRRLGTSAASAAYNVFADVNGSGAVNALDLAATRRNLNRSMPQAATALLRV